MNVTIDTAKDTTKSRKQDEPKYNPVTYDDPDGVGEAQRFAGDPLILFARLDRAMSELTFYKSSLRHRNERETSTVKPHDTWRRCAVALARQLADDLEAGALEPNSEVQKKLSLAQALVDDAMKMQRNDQ